MLYRSTSTIRERGEQVLMMNDKPKAKNVKMNEDID
jgi:hypothetical protein